MKKICLVLMLALCLMLTSLVSALADNVIEVPGLDNKDLQQAVYNASAGTTVRLTDNVSISQLHLKTLSSNTVADNITLDLNGKTLTLTTSNNYGIRADGHCTITSSATNPDGSVKKGKILHKGAIAVIKAWNVAAIENIDIEATKTDSNGRIGGIVIQQGGCVDLIKNVSLYGDGLHTGIEVMDNNDPNAPLSLKSAENLTITVKDKNASNPGLGLWVKAPVGTVKSATISGGTNGVRMEQKGRTPVSLTLEDCKISDTGVGVLAYDEESVKPGYTNTGSFFLSIDEKSSITSKDNSEFSVNVSVGDKGEANTIIGSDNQNDEMGACYILKADGKTKSYFRAHEWKQDAEKKVCVNCGMEILLPNAGGMPQTGDESRIMLWVALMMISGAALLVNRRKVTE